MTGRRTAITDSESRAAVENKENRMGRNTHSCVTTRTGPRSRTGLEGLTRARGLAEPSAQGNAPCLYPLTAPGTPIPSSADIRRVFPILDRGIVRALSILRGDWPQGGVI